MENNSYGCGGRLCFPKMAAAMSSILHALLWCDFDLPHQELESNSPSLDLGLAAVTLLYPVKWDRSNAAGFLRLGRKKCDGFCLGFLEPSFSGCTRLEWPLFELSTCTSLWPGQGGCSEPSVSGYRCTLEYLPWNFVRPLWCLGLVRAGRAIWIGYLRLDWILRGPHTCFSIPLCYVWGWPENHKNCACGVV